MFHKYFPLAVSSPNNVWAVSRTINCRLGCNISQILLLYKVWGYYNKFDSMNDMSILPVCQNATVLVCGAWVRINYVLCSKTYNIFAGLFWIPAGSWRADLGAHICESRFYIVLQTQRYFFNMVIMQTYHVCIFHEAKEHLDDLTTLVKLCLLKIIQFRK